MDQKIALIVGPGHAGLGEALATRFGHRGYTIALLGRKQAPLDALVTTLAAEHVNVFAVTADLGNQSSLAAAIKSVTSQGTLQVAIYTATMRTKNKPSSLDQDVLTESLISNLLGAVTLTHLALPYVKQAGDGVLLYTGSIVAAKPGITDIEQSIGKVGLRNYVLALNKELAGSGVFAGMVTINTYIRKGRPGHMDPMVIAKAFEDLAVARNKAEVAYH